LLEYRNGELHIGGVSCEELAQEFDTPLYVIDEERIRQNYRRLKQALQARYPKTRIYYAVKANSNLSILRILHIEGAYFDVASPGEAFIVSKAGVDAERIMFTGTSVRDDELEYLLDLGVYINVDSLSELRRLLRIGAPSFISARINVGVGAGHHQHCITAGPKSKFGLAEGEAVEAYRMAKNAGVERFGIHTHIGSGIMEPTPFIQAMQRLLAVASNVKQSLNIDFEHVDIGGGIGVPYRPEEPEFDLETYAEGVITKLKGWIEENGSEPPIFAVEPGRYIVCDACILLTRINTVKNTPYRRILGVDAGFHTLARPMLYGSYHHIIPVRERNAENSGTGPIYDVAGPICESGDLLARGRALPEMREGDLLAILNAGAYGFSMSSQYNSRPRPAEVLVKEGRYELVRERETLEDLLRHQRIASWLR